MATDAPTDIHGKQQRMHAIQKLDGYEWWESVGSPKYVVAPMVDQSELAWRILSRLHGATLAYTPMFHAAIFGKSEAYARAMFDCTEGSLEGIAPYDRPLVVQFCANNKEEWLKAAEKVVGRCDAVDLNLGCPQGIARKGRYGAFLMEEWDLIKEMVDYLHMNLAIPVIAKLRVFPTIERTVEYASHVCNAGAQLLTVHGRTREAKGRDAGMASWDKIKAVTALLAPRIPILANGGLPSSNEVTALLEETQAVGVMSAEGNLYNPMIFSPQNAAGGRAYFGCLPADMQSALRDCNRQLKGEWDKDRAAYAPTTYIAAQYLAIVRTLPSTKTAGSSIKAHLFKLFRPIWAAGHHLDLRNDLGKVGGFRDEAQFGSDLLQYDQIVDCMYNRLQSDIAEGILPAGSYRPLSQSEVVEVYNGVIPYSHAQPYLRITSQSKSTSVDQEMETVNKRRRETSFSSVATAEVENEKDNLSMFAKSIKRQRIQQAVRCSGKGALQEGFKCPNIAADRCAFQACLTCCSGAGSNSGSVTSSGKELLTEGICAFHLDKRKQADEKKDAKKIARKAKASLM